MVVSLIDPKALSFIIGDPVTSVPHLISAALFRARDLEWLIAKVFLEIKNTLKRGAKWGGNERAEACIKEGVLFS